MRRHCSAAVATYAATACASVTGGSSSSSRHGPMVAMATAEARRSSSSLASQGDGAAAAGTDVITNSRSSRFTKRDAPPPPTSSHASKVSEVKEALTPQTSTLSTPFTIKKRESEGGQRFGGAGNSAERKREGRFGGSSSSPRFGSSSNRENSTRDRDSSSSPSFLRREGEKERGGGFRSSSSSPSSSRFDSKREERRDSSSRPSFGARALSAPSSFSASSSSRFDNNKSASLLPRRDSDGRRGDERGGRFRSPPVSSSGASFLGSKGSERDHHRERRGGSGSGSGSGSAPTHPPARREERLHQLRAEASAKREATGIKMLRKSKSQTTSTSPISKEKEAVVGKQHSSAAASSSALEYETIEEDGASPSQAEKHSEESVIVAQTDNGANKKDDVSSAVSDDVATTADDSHPAAAQDGGGSQRSVPSQEEEKEGDSSPTLSTDQCASSSSSVSPSVNATAPPPAKTITPSSTAGKQSSSRFLKKDALNTVAGSAGKVAMIFSVVPPAKGGDACKDDDAAKESLNVEALPLEPTHARKSISPAEEAAQELWRRQQRGTFTVPSTTTSSSPTPASPRAPNAVKRATTADPLEAGFEDSAASPSAVGTATTTVVDNTNKQSRGSGGGQHVDAYHGLGSSAAIAQPSPSNPSATLNAVTSMRLSFLSQHPSSSSSTASSPLNGRNATDEVDGTSSSSAAVIAPLPHLVQYCNTMRAQYKNIKKQEVLDHCLHQLGGYFSHVLAPQLRLSSLAKAHQSLVFQQQQNANGLGRSDGGEEEDALVLDGRGEDGSFTNDANHSATRHGKSNSVSSSSGSNGPQNPTHIPLVFDSAWRVGDIGRQVPTHMLLAAPTTTTASTTSSSSPTAVVIRPQELVTYLPIAALSRGMQQHYSNANRKGAQYSSPSSQGGGGDISASLSGSSAAEAAAEDLAATAAAAAAGVGGVAAQSADINADFTSASFLMFSAVPQEGYEALLKAMQPLGVVNAARLLNHITFFYNSWIEIEAVGAAKKMHGITNMTSLAPGAMTTHCVRPVKTLETTAGANPTASKGMSDVDEMSTVNEESGDDDVYSTDPADWGEFSKTVRPIVNTTAGPPAPLSPSSHLCPHLVSCGLQQMYRSSLLKNANKKNSTDSTAAQVKGGGASDNNTMNTNNKSQSAAANSSTSSSSSSVTPSEGVPPITAMESAATRVRHHSAAIALLWINVLAKYLALHCTEMDLVGTSLTLLALSSGGLRIPSMQQHYLPRLVFGIAESNSRASQEWRRTGKISSRLPNSNTSDNQASSSSTNSSSSSSSDFPSVVTTNATKIELAAIVSSTIKLISAYPGIEEGMPAEHAPIPSISTPSFAFPPPSRTEAAAATRAVANQVSVSSNSGGGLTTYNTNRPHCDRLPNHIAHAYNRWTPLMHVIQWSKHSLVHLLTLFADRPHELIPIINLLHRYNALGSLCARETFANKVANIIIPRDTRERRPQGSNAVRSQLVAVFGEVLRRRWKDALASSSGGAVYDAIGQALLPASSGTNSKNMSVGDDDAEEDPQPSPQSVASTSVVSSPSNANVVDQQRLSAVFSPYLWVSLLEQSRLLFADSSVKAKVASFAGVINAPAMSAAVEANKEKNLAALNPNATQVIRTNPAVVGSINNSLSPSSGFIAPQHPYFRNNTGASDIFSSVTSLSSSPSAKGYYNAASASAVGLGVAHVRNAVDVILSEEASSAAANDATASSGVSDGSGGDATVKAPSAPPLPSAPPTPTVLFKDIAPVDTLVALISKRLSCVAILGGYLLSPDTRQRIGTEVYSVQTHNLQLWVLNLIEDMEVATKVVSDSIRAAETGTAVGIVRKASSSISCSADDNESGKSSEADSDAGDALFEGGASDASSTAMTRVVTSTVASRINPILAQQLRHRLSTIASLRDELLRLSTLRVDDGFDWSLPADARPSLTPSFVTSPNIRALLTIGRANTELLAQRLEALPSIAGVYLYASTPSLPSSPMSSSPAKEASQDNQTPANTPDAVPGEVKQSAVTSSSSTSTLASDLEEKGVKKDNAASQRTPSESSGKTSVSVSSSSSSPSKPTKETLANKPLSEISAMIIDSVLKVPLGHVPVLNNVSNTKIDLPPLNSQQQPSKGGGDATASGGSTALATARHNTSAAEHNTLIIKGQHVVAKRLVTAATRFAEFLKQQEEKEGEGEEGDAEKEEKETTPSPPPPHPPLTIDDVHTSLAAIHMLGMHHTTGLNQLAAAKLWAQSPLHYFKDPRQALDYAAGSGAGMGEALASSLASRGGATVSGNDDASLKSKADASATKGGAGSSGGNTEAAEKASAALNTVLLYFGGLLPLKNNTKKKNEEGCEEDGGADAMASVSVLPLETIISAYVLKIISAETASALIRKRFEAALNNTKATTNATATTAPSETHEDHSTTTAATTGTETEGTNDEAVVGVTAVEGDEEDAQIMAFHDAIRSLFLSDILPVAECNKSKLPSSTAEDSQKEKGLGEEERKGVAEATAEKEEGHAATAHNTTLLNLNVLLDGIGRVAFDLRKEEVTEATAVSDLQQQNANANKNNGEASPPSEESDKVATEEGEGEPSFAKDEGEATLSDASSESEVAAAASPPPPSPSPSPSPSSPSFTSYCILSALAMEIITVKARYAHMTASREKAVAAQLTQTQNKAAEEEEEEDGGSNVAEAAVPKPTTPSSSSAPQHATSSLLEHRLSYCTFSDEPHGIGLLPRYKPDRQLFGSGAYVLSHLIATSVHNGWHVGKEAYLREYVERCADAEEEREEGKLEEGEEGVVAESSDSSKPAPLAGLDAANNNSSKASGEDEVESAASRSDSSEKRASSLSGEDGDEEALEKDQSSASEEDAAAARRSQLLASTKADAIARQALLLECPNLLFYLSSSQAMLDANGLASSSSFSSFSLHSVDTLDAIANAVIAHDRASIASCQAHRSALCARALQAGHDRLLLWVSSTASILGTRWQMASSSSSAAATPSRPLRFVANTAASAGSPSPPPPAVARSPTSLALLAGTDPSLTTTADFANIDLLLRLTIDHFLNRSQCNVGMFKRVTHALSSLGAQGAPVDVGTSLVVSANRLYSDRKTQVLGGTYDFTVSCVLHPSTHFGIVMMLNNVKNENMTTAMQKHVFRAITIAGMSDLITSQQRSSVVELAKATMVSDCLDLQCAALRAMAASQCGPSSVFYQLASVVLMRKEALSMSQLGDLLACAPHVESCDNILCPSLRLEVLDRIRNVLGWAEVKALLGYLAVGYIGDCEMWSAVVRRYRQELRAQQLLSSLHHDDNSSSDAASGEKDANDEGSDDDASLPPVDVNCMPSELRAALCESACSYLVGF